MMDTCIFKYDMNKFAGRVLRGVTHLSVLVVGRVLLFFLDGLHGTMAGCRIPGLYICDVVVLVYNFAIHPSN